MSEVAKYVVGLVSGPLQIHDKRGSRKYAAEKETPHVTPDSPVLLRPHRFISHVLDPYCQYIGLFWTLEMTREIEFDNRALYTAYCTERNLKMRSNQQTQNQL